MFSQTGNVVVLRANFGCEHHGSLVGRIIYPQGGSLDGATIIGKMIRCTNPVLIGNCRHPPKYAVDFTGRIERGIFGDRFLTVEYEMEIWHPVDCRFVRGEKRTDTYVAAGSLVSTGGVRYLKDPDVDEASEKLLNDLLDSFLPDRYLP